MMLTDLLLLVAAIVAIVDLALARGRSLPSWAVLCLVAALVVMTHGLVA
jgi:hypothetical protein